MELKKRFGKAVQRIRTAVDISQDELGSRIGGDQAYVSRIESGQQNLTLDKVDEIASALGVDVSEFFAKAGK